jgi:hypothetical protein
MDFVVSLIFFLILNSTIHKCIFNYVKRNRPCLNNNSFKLYYWYTRLSQKKPAQYLRGRHTHTLYVVIFFVTAVYTRTPVMFSQNFGYVSLYIYLMVFNATFNNISVILWRSTSRTRRKPPTCRKSLTNFIT